MDKEHIYTAREIRAKLTEALEYARTQKVIITKNGERFILVSETVIKQARKKNVELAAPIEDRRDHRVSVSADELLLDEIRELTSEIEAADTMNQDPDYWKAIAQKKVAVQELWDKWHMVTGR